MNSGTSSISVVVPVFNEGPGVKANIDLLIAEVEPHFSNFEIIIVSDGSTDDTDSVVRSIQDPRVRKILNPENRGKGFAVRTGFAQAKGDYVFFVDGGMELHPKELRVLFGLMNLYGADIVIGSKRHPQSEIYYPIYRRALSAVYQGLVRALFKIRATDTQVGMKLFKGEVIRAILPDLRIDRYGFDLELLALAARHGYTKILEAPVKLDYFTKRRSIPTDLLHVLWVGLSVLRDTAQLYLRLRHVQKGTKEGSQL